jgi:gliding motility-associated-like protein
MYLLLKRKETRIAITWGFFLLIICLCSNANCQTCNLLCNTDFENIQYSSTSDVKYPSSIPCWKTTDATGVFEVWCNNFMNVPPHSGNQFIELNAYSVGTVYQDFVVNPGMNLIIKFAHRGRDGVDVMQVRVGPVGGSSSTSLGNFSDGNGAWGFYSVPYSVPLGVGSNFRLEFISVSATGGNPRIGNFLDDISIEFSSTLSQTVNYTPISCNGNTTTATINGSGGFLPYTFSINTGPYTSSNNFIVSSGTHSFNIKDNLGCIKSSTVVISPPTMPAAPTASVTVQPNCTSPTGTIVVSAPAGANIQYSIGGPYQSSGTFSNLTPNSYSVTTKDVNTGCISAVTNVTVNPVPAGPAAPTASVTVQPNCTSPTGTIIVTAPVGANIQYSIGGLYQSSGTFSNLAPNSYSVTAKDVNTGCISAVKNLTVNPAPGSPAAPTASVTVQPNCTSATGIIIVTAPAGVNIQYSIGGPYQSSGTFLNLAPNSYSVTTKDVNTGCISAVTNVTVNPIPAGPAAPTASVTVQPNCTSPTGTIVITAPAGANIQYSIGGTYQSSGSFSNLAPNSYSVTAKDVNTGCISAVMNLTVNSVAAGPAAPTASVTVQPNCTSPTGTIVVSAPAGANIQYSIGGTYQSSGIFASLATNSYSVTAKDVNTGCMSAVKNLTVNPAPAGPATPTASVTVQPTCTSTSGIIVVTAPAGANIQYSIGGSYQSSGTFSNLAPNSYSVTAKDVNTGCMSTATLLNVQPQNNLLPPVANSAGRCGKGTLLLTATSTDMINWYDDPGLTNLIYSGTSFSPYLDTAKKYYVVTASGSCKSSATVVTGSVYAIPKKPNLPPTSFICPGQSIVLNAGVYDSYLWQDNSKLPTFTVSAIGTYTVIVTLNPGGCKDSASVKISNLSNCDDIYFPNAFTPNADLINNNFGAIGNLPDITNFSLFIYNRWGEIVFTSNNPYEKWDGRYKGQAQDVGNFVWVAKYIFKGGVKTKKGTLLLIK